MARRALPGGAHPVSLLLSRDEWDSLVLACHDTNTPKSDMMRKAWNFYRRFYMPLKRLAEETVDD